MGVFKRSALVTLATAFVLAGCDSGQAPAATAAPKTYDDKLRDCMVETLKTDAHSRYIDVMILTQKDGLKKIWRMLPMDAVFVDQELGGHNTMIASIYAERSAASSDAVTLKEVEFEATHYVSLFPQKLAGRATVSATIEDSGSGPVISDKFKTTTLIHSGDAVANSRMQAVAEGALQKIKNCVL